MPFTMSGNNDGWSFNRFDEYEAKLAGEQQVEEQEEETIEEGYGKYQKGGEVKGAHREADTGKVVDKAEIGKIYYPNMPKKKTSVAKRKEEEAAKKLKEQLEATGIFSAEEIEALVESNCGDRAYPSGQRLQKGGEVKDCEKCKGKGCDHCKDKGTHKKEEVKEAAKPDFLDMDGDGNKEEPMKKALKEKGSKKKEDVKEAYGRPSGVGAMLADRRNKADKEAAKEDAKKEVKEDVDPIVEGAVAALGALLGKAGGAALKGAGAAAKTMAKDAAVDSIKSIPGKVGNSIKNTAKSTQSSETADTED